MRVQVTLIIPIFQRIRLLNELIKGMTVNVLRVHIYIYIYKYVYIRCIPHYVSIRGAGRSSGVEHLPVKVGITQSSLEGGCIYSGPQLVHQRLCYVLSCQWESAYLYMHFLTDKTAHAYQKE